MTCDEFWGVCEVKNACKAVSGLGYAHLWVAQ